MMRSAVGIAFIVLAPRISIAMQGIIGDYILLKEGTELMGVTITSVSNGRITGKASVGYTIPFAGTINGQNIAFTTSFTDGTTARWSGRIAGQTLNVTVTDQSGESQQFALVRRGTGWTSQSPLAQQWTRKLVGQEIANTERTGGGSSGSAVKDMTVAFCAAGKAVYNERFALSISVPGMAGGQTSRKADSGRWRVISSGNTAAIEVSGNEGEVFQMGIREGSAGIINVAGQPMRLRDAGRKC